MFHLNKKCFLTLITVILGAFVQAYVIKVFIQPANLLSSGFTGVAILIEKITSTYFHFSFSTSLGMIVLNVPVAILCYKSISPRFTFFSLLEVFLASFFLKIIHFPPIFDDTLLNVIFGGTLYGLMTASILKMNASTGGTDFVALYISNKKGKSIWSYVFIFNSIILLIYHRYERVTLQVTTKKAQAVMDKYIKNYRHGISCVEAIGGYSHEKMYLLHTVVSSYEVLDIVELMKTVDSHIIVNVIKTENFFGGFYRPPID